MQFEDVWKMFIEIMKEHVVLNVNFKGFMVDSTFFIVKLNLLINIQKVDMP
jgi:hypothetical protein